MQPWNYFFHAKVYGFIKDNITIDDNILVYKVIQFIAFSLFTITNEYAFDTFGIQLCPCFLWHMSKCNIMTKIQMIYGRFVFAPTLFNVMLKSTWARDLILDICCSCYYFYQKFMIQLHMLQHTFHTFNKCSIFLSAIQFCYGVYGMMCASQCHSFVEYII
jgi:hypothetical protein